MTCPSVDTSRGVFASIPTWSSRGLSSTRARLLPVLVSLFRMAGVLQSVQYVICVRTAQPRGFIAYEQQACGFDSSKHAGVASRPASTVLGGLDGLGFGISGFFA